MVKIMEKNLLASPQYNLGTYRFMFWKFYSIYNAQRINERKWNEYTTLKPCIDLSQGDLYDSMEKSD